MIILRKTHLLLPLLALGTTLALAAPVHAQDRYYKESGGTAVSLQLNFGTAPHWEGIRGTRVQVIREADRPGYDMFRYGRYFYVYNNHNDRWYMSRRWRGRFTLIDSRSVPRELRRVPRERWNNYPSAWQDHSYQRSGGSSASLQVSFGTAPRWAGISGTRVEAVALAQRPSYDVFRYDGTYYAYNNNQWYASRRESGEFTLIDDRSVPGEFSNVPREHWRNYPSAWHNKNGTPPGQAKKNR